MRTGINGQFTGLIDEVRIYDRALTRVEIETLYETNDLSSGDNSLWNNIFDKTGGVLTSGGIGSYSWDVNNIFDTDVARLRLRSFDGVNHSDWFETGEFTIDNSAAAKDLANSTDGLGATKTEVDKVVTAVITNAAGVDIAADIIVIEGQTDDIGVAGAGLTAINLPNQTMDIVGDITGNLSGSVGNGAPRHVDDLQRLGHDAFLRGKADSVLDCQQPDRRASAS